MLCQAEFAIMGWGGGGGGCGAPGGNKAFGCLCWTNYDACIVFEDVPFVDLINFVFTCMPGESYCRQFRSLLSCSCDFF